MTYPLFEIDNINNQNNICKFTIYKPCYPFSLSLCYYLALTLPAVIRYKHNQKKKINTHKNTHRTERFVGMLVSTLLLIQLL